VKIALPRSSTKFVIDRQTRTTKFGFDCVTVFPAPPQSPCAKPCGPRPGLWKEPAFGAGSEDSAAKSACVDNVYLPGKWRPSVGLCGWKEEMIFHGNYFRLLIDPLSQVKS
jgi:hypothetical protein